LNIIVISPHFPTNFYNFCVRLKELGANVLGIADVPYQTLTPKLKSSLTEYFRVNDMKNYDELVRAVGFLTYKHGKIDRIESHNEYWLETDARLRTDFNVYGIKNDAIENMKAKSKMKKMYIKAGVPVARGEIVTYDSDINDFIDKAGYPVVLKPDIGVGAERTYKINNQTDLEYFLEHKPKDIVYFVEEFVKGDVVSYDGLVDRHGNLVFSAYEEYSEGTMETVTQDNDLYYIIMRDIPKEIEELGLKTVNIFGIKERFFHFEFFKTQKNEFIALEVNMRPPGGVTMDIFNYSCDIDLYREWANLVINDQFGPTDYKHKFYVAHIGRKNNKNYAYSHESILSKYRTNIMLSEKMAEIFAPGLGDFIYVARSERLDYLKEIIAYILKPKQ